VYKSHCSSLSSFLHPPSTSFLLLSFLFPITYSLCSYFNVRDKFSHQYRTKGKIMVLRLLIFKDPKDSDNSECYSDSLQFCTLTIVLDLKSRTRRFGNWISFRPQVKGGCAPVRTSVNLSDWYACLYLPPEHNPRAIRCRATRRNVEVFTPWSMCLEASA
jgi:hypothetical protein